MYTRRHVTTVNLVSAEVPHGRHRQTEDHARPRERPVQVVNQVERVLFALVIGTLDCDVAALVNRRCNGNVLVHERRKAADSYKGYKKAR